MPGDQLGFQRAQLEQVSALGSFPMGGVAVVLGASGGIGRALVHGLETTGRFKAVLGFSRRQPIEVDLTQEDQIAQAARRASDLGEVRLVMVATGVLSQGAAKAERTWGELDPAAMMAAFQVNTIGPALVAKHFLPILPKEGKSVLAVISARVGSIGDNHLGGWYSYRASKAALNQIVRTASIELARRRPHAVCLALHPGTVDTALSRPFAKSGLDVQTPEVAAERLVRVIDAAGASQSGQFLDHHGAAIPW